MKINEWPIAKWYGKKIINQYIEIFDRKIQYPIAIKIPKKLKKLVKFGLYNIDRQKEEKFCAIYGPFYKLRNSFIMLKQSSTSKLHLAYILEEGTPNKGIIGRGKQGIVKSLQWEDGSRSVAKIGSSTIANDLLKKEAKLLKQIYHDPKRVKTFSTFSGKQYLIQDLFCGQELFLLLESGKLKSLSIIGQCNLLLKIAQEIEKAHKKNIIHNDIKLENLICDIVDTEDFDVHLIDYGLANKLPHGVNFVIETMRKGTPQYFAPEIFRPKQNKKNLISHYIYSKASDIYSFGIIISGMSFLGCMQPREFWARWAARNRLLNKDPQKRPNIDTIIAQLSKLKQELARDTGV